jgi:hypothetical protein
MAREVVISYRDDLDGTLDADEEVRLGVDGTVYVLDLTTEHAERLRAELAPWLAAAHETIRDKSTKPKPAPTPRAIVPSAAASAPEPASAPPPQPPAGAAPTPHTRAGAGQRRRSGQTAAARAIPDPELRRAIRAWGRANGHQVATHGFLSPELVEAYHAAHQCEHGDKLAGTGA